MTPGARFRQALKEEKPLQVIGTIGPGRHQIDADELPFLGAFIDFATGGKAYRAELFFVGTREYTGNTFGGRISASNPFTPRSLHIRVQ